MPSSVETRRRGPVAAEVMTTEFVHVPADASLTVAWRHLFQSGTSHAVVTRDGHAVGVLDDRTVAMEWPSGSFEPLRRPVSTVVPGSAATVLASTGVQDVAMLMVAEDVCAVAVVDELGRPVGVVRAIDLVAALARHGIGDEGSSRDAHESGTSG